MGDPRFLGTEQRKRMGAESSHLAMTENKPQRSLRETPEIEMADDALRDHVFYHHGLSAQSSRYGNERAHDMAHLDGWLDGRTGQPAGADHPRH